MAADDLAARTSSALAHLRAAERELAGAVSDLAAVRGVVGTLRTAEGLQLDARRLADNLAAELRLKSGRLSLAPTEPGARR